jgi:hypothetical protein
MLMNSKCTTFIASIAASLALFGCSGEVIGEDEVATARVVTQQGPPLRHSLLTPPSETHSVAVSVSGPRTTEPPEDTVSVASSSPRESGEPIS